MEKAFKVLLPGLTSVNTEVLWEVQDMAFSSPPPQSVRGRSALFTPWEGQSFLPVCGQCLGASCHTCMLAHLAWF